MMEWSKYLSSERASKRTKSGGEFDKRTPFESDYGRVMFSSAIRRMHDKTQVIPLTNGDSVLTRLTHSIQVMNIAESLIINYTRSESFEKDNTDPEKRSLLASNLLAVTRSAAFVHDVGNPPFGHFGETVIQEYFKNHKAKQNNFCATAEDEKLLERQALDFTQFDGNAQGLRILARLQYIGALDGLNLTFATLAAYMKYPNTGEKEKNGYIGRHKHGVFWTEEKLFEKIVKECNLECNNGKIKRHPLSFLVEAADSIAYLTMDIEDGYSLKWFSFETLISEINRILDEKKQAQSIEKAKKEGTEVEEATPQSIIDIISYQSKGYDEKEKKIKLGANKKAIVDFRVALIQYLVNKAVDNFIANIDGIDSGDYNHELIEHDDNNVALALKDFTKQHILSRREICSEEMTGRTVLIGLFDMLSLYAFSKDPAYRSRVKSVISRSRLEIAMHENSFPDEGYKFFTDNELYDYDIEKMGSYGRWRMIVDFVSSMTDKYAVYLYQQLSGNRL